MNRMQQAVTISALLLFSTMGICSQIDAEDVFASAQSYTVEVKSSVETPFLQDEAGLIEGAGFLINSTKGWILTNAHVSSRSPAKISIKFKDKEDIDAKRIYVDSFHDITILKVDSKHTDDISSAKLMCDGMPKTGHPVGAYGHPWGLKHTGTMGVISGITSNHGREMLQTDAPINGGNSGGPLISLKTGLVIGMNTSKMSDENDQNTNFAESMKYACGIIKLLEKGLAPSLPKFPFVLFSETINSNVLKVSKVLDHDSFGFMVGDIILKINNSTEVITNKTRLLNALRGSKGNTKFLINRNGKEIALNSNLDWQRNVLDHKAIYLSGAVIGNIEHVDYLDGFYNKPVVLSVNNGSDAEASGLSIYQIVTHVNGIVVDTIDEFFEESTKSANDGSEIILYTLQEDVRDNSFYTFKEIKVSAETLEWLSVDG